MQAKYKCGRCGYKSDRSEDIHRLLYKLDNDGSVEALFCCRSCDNEVSKDDTEFVINGIAKKDPDWSTEVAILDKIKEKQNG